MKGNRCARKFKPNQHGMIQMLPTIGFAIILLYAIMYIGSYTNGTIGSSLISTYEDNLAGGAMNRELWNNASGNGTVAFRNTSLESGCIVREIQATSGVNVNNNGSDAIWFNLTANGGHEYVNQTIAAGAWLNTTLATLVTASNVSAAETWVNYSWRSNRSTNRVYQYFVGSYFNSSDYRTGWENGTANTLANLSGDFDSNTEIVSVAAIVCVLTVPLMAIAAVRRLF